MAVIDLDHCGLQGTLSTLPPGIESLSSDLQALACFYCNVKLRPYPKGAQWHMKPPNDMSPSFRLSSFFFGQYFKPQCTKAIVECMSWIFGCHTGTYPVLQMPVMPLRAGL